MKEGESVKHTPGPWEYVRETEHMGGYPCNVSHKVKVGQELLTVGCHGYGWGEPGKEIEANAHLVAAAPELYEALKEYEKWEAALILDDEVWAEGAMPRLTEELYDWMLRLQDMRIAAIEKAKGVPD